MTGQYAEAGAHAASRVWRRVRGALGFGRVAAADSSGGVQLLQVEFSALEKRPGLPDVAHYGFTSVPHPTARAVVVFAAGDRSNGVVVGTNDAASRKTGLQPGEAAIYTDLGQTVYLTRSGIVIDGGGLPITVQNMGTLTVKGAISATADVVAGAGASQVSLLNHLTNNVQPGSGQSGPPVVGT